jgi:hypothetical protein
VSSSPTDGKPEVAAVPVGELLDYEIPLKHT